MIIHSTPVAIEAPWKDGWSPDVPLRRGSQVEFYQQL